MLLRTFHMKCMKNEPIPQIFEIFFNIKSGPATKHEKGDDIAENAETSCESCRYTSNPVVQTLKIEVFTFLPMTFEHSLFL